jgi:IS30 family transposase
MERSNKTIIRELRRCLTNEYCAKAAYTHAFTIRTKARKFTKRSQKLIDKVEGFAQIEFHPRADSKTISERNANTKSLLRYSLQHCVCTFTGTLI